MSQSSEASAGAAVFVTGSTMRHVLVMTASSAVGLMAIFFVDAITLFYISLLGDAAQTAAVGRASYVIGFMIAISVGMMIGSSVLVARAIGGGREGEARSLAGTALIMVFVFNVGVAVVMLALTDWFLAILNAEGDALRYAQTYLRIILPGMPFMSVGMTCMGLLRARGDARRSMYITLIGGAATAILDPLFIFTFGMEVTGAAIVSLLTRFAFAGLGLYYVLGVHKMVDWPKMGRLIADTIKIWALAGPALVTNLAAPVGAFLIANKIAEFGDAALAGQSVVDRLIPLAFGTIFALSGAVGPIIGQNVGAGRMDRVRRTFIDAMIFNVVYVLLAWGALYLARNAIITAYSATGDMALMINLFCAIAAGAFLFNGFMFVTNAAFNNLGKPLWATYFNWARQTLGVVPFIYFGALWGGLEGIAWGVLVGGLPFALIAILTALRLIRRMSAKQEMLAVVPVT
ncbi:MAG: MATE family efflux transporter [Alphaproteobacteria bacterium]|nr:MATE family efflux transporter [Alphaproteobacteria bacterium]